MMKNVIIFMALIVALTSAQVTLTPGYPYRTTTAFRTWSYFSLILSESTINYVQLVTTVDAGTPFYYASVGSLPTFQSNMWKYENVTGGPVTKYFYNPNIDLNTGNYSTSVLYIGVYGYTNAKYSLTVYTQGPISIYDRQVSSPTFPVPNTYLFYKFQVDSMLRALQVVVQPSTWSSDYYFYMSNSTNLYPVYRGRYQYSSTAYSSYRTSCLTVNYPYPGTYRLGLSTSNRNYTIQFVENGLGSCKIEN